MNLKMNDIFTIGSFCFRLICPNEIVPPMNFLKFRGGSRVEYTYTIVLSSEFPVPNGKVLTRRADILVTQTESGECRYIGVNGQPEPYACYVERDETSAVVYLNPNRIKSLNIDPVFTSLLALERRLIRHDALCFTVPMWKWTAGRFSFRLLRKQAKLHKQTYGKNTGGPVLSMETGR